MEGVVNGHLLHGVLTESLQWLPESPSLPHINLQGPSFLGKVRELAPDTGGSGPCLPEFLSSLLLRAHSLHNPLKLSLCVTHSPTLSSSDTFFFFPKLHVIPLHLHYCTCALSVSEPVLCQRYGNNGRALFNRILVLWCYINRRLVLAQWMLRRRGTNSCSFPRATVPQSLPVLRSRISDVHVGSTPEICPLFGSPVLRLICV